MGMEDNIDPTKDIRFPFLTDKAGTYEVELNEFIKAKSNADKKEFVKAVVTVIESDGETAFPAGTKANIFIKQDEEYEYYKKELPQLVAAITGSPIADYKGELVRDLAGEDQPHTGARFTVKVAQGINKKNGQPKVRRDGSPMLFASYEAATN